MANEIVAARTKVKTKLDITDTTFDTMLLECVEQAVPRLAPFVQYQLAEDTTVSLASGDDSFTLPNAASSLERLYTRTSSTDVWREVDLWRQHRNKVYISEGISTATSVKVIAKRPFIYTDADLALLASDYPAAMLPLYLFTMAEFAILIVGNKRKFNIYQQMNGVRTLDEMKDLVRFYEDRAISILENELSAEGQ
jgi:hypothetical protein